MPRLIHHWLLLTLLYLLCFPPLQADEAEPLELVGPFHPGFASVPWHGVFSADGRWLAIVESHPTKYIAVFDAQTRKRVWRVKTEVGCASRRPAFTRDGERLVLVEGDGITVRRRMGEKWEEESRIPLGFRPGISSRSLPIVLSADEQVAWIVAEGRAHAVTLRGPEAGVAALKVEHVRSVHAIRNRLAVSRRSDSLAETLLYRDPKGEPEEIMPFAIVSVSPVGRTWLVAEGPRPASGQTEILHLVDAATHAMLGEVPVAPRERLGQRHLTAAEFSPDGRFLVTVESLHTGRVRDARTGRLLQSIRQFEEDRMIGIAWSADGGSLVTAGRRKGDAVLLFRLREGHRQAGWHQRLRTALFERRVPAGSFFGRDRLDPLLNPSTRHLLEGESHRQAKTLLSRFLSETTPTGLSAIERALIQRDLWAVFDWVLGEPMRQKRAEAVALGQHLAKAIAHVAMTDKEIAGLPDALDSRGPGRVSHPTDLLIRDGPWVCLGDEEGRILAPFHLRKREGRSGFTVHVKLPGGRAETVAWVVNTRNALQGHFGEELIPPTGLIPDPPPGTRFVLLRRALLINREGKLRATPLVERIQMRVHGEEDSFFEWTLKARGLLDGEGPALAPVGTRERGFVFFQEGHGGDLFEENLVPFERLGPRNTILATCTSCHARHFEARRIQSVTHSLGPIGPLPTGLKASTAASETELFMRWKSERPGFVRLLRAFHQ